MITAEEFVLELDGGTEQKHFKLATVVDLFENDTAKLQFDGEDAPSEKQYAYLGWYIPEVGDRVLLGILSGTYIILGKVNFNVPPSKEEEIDRYLFNLKKVIMEKGLSVSGNTDLENMTADEVAIDGDLGVSGEVMAQKVSASGQVSTNQLETEKAFVHTQLTAKSVSITEDLNTGEGATIGRTLNVNGGFSHKGSSIGFFGRGLSNKQSINTIREAEPDNKTLRNKVNEIIAAGHWYGLIGGS